MRDSSSWFRHRRQAPPAASGDRWAVRAFDTLSRDLAYALRGLARAPGFTATVIATLGLGLGANVAMFGVVDRLLYRPLAFLRDPGTVHRLYWQWDDASQTRTTRTAAYRRYLDLRESAQALSALAAFSERDVAVGEGEQAQERRITAVSASYFDFFDAAPVRGRYFAADETAPRAAPMWSYSPTTSGSRSSGGGMSSARVSSSGRYAPRSSAWRRATSTA